MATAMLPANEFFESLDEVSFELFHLLSSADSITLNLVPPGDKVVKERWTAAQLASHVTKSNHAIRQALDMEGEPAERNADERVPELKKMFLDFTTRFNSPEFIRPKPGYYEKDVLISDLKRSIGQLKDTGNRVNLSDIISLPAFGEITKFELLHFVLYHTQRHIHQLKNILHALENDKIYNNKKHKTT